MGRIILPKKARSHRILLFVQDTCKPCLELTDELIKVRFNMYEIIEIMDMSPIGATYEASSLAKKWDIRRVPTLVVVSNITDEPVEKICAIKPILQNINRILNTYWTRDF